MFNIIHLFFSFVILKFYIFCLNLKALLKMGIRGVTVSDVKGFGAQGGSKERQGGKYVID
jgi:nitrogen regulatory protein PII